MHSAHVKSLISLLDAAVYCTLCEPPVPVEIRARVYYRLQDHDILCCPNGHQGTLRDYKHAAAHPGEQAGPFILRQSLADSLRLAGKPE